MTPIRCGARARAWSVHFCCPTRRSVRSSNKSPLLRRHKKSGVRHIVKLSQLHADVNSPGRFLRYHGAVEAAVQDAGLTFTFLRPNLYMQGLLNFRQSIKEKSAFFAAAGEGRISAVDVRDLADVAVAALTGSQHDNKSYSLTGPEALTFTEMAKQLSAALGRTITFVDVPPEAMREALSWPWFPSLASRWSAGRIRDVSSW